MRASTVALVLALAGCTAKPDPKPEPEPAAKQPIEHVQEPAPAQPEPRLNLDLDARELTTPTAGRYALALQAKQTGFVSTELRLDSSIDGGASIDLRDDGSVHACFWGTARSSGSISEYASNDGQHHYNETNISFRQGMWGTWLAEPAAARATLQLKSVDYRSCERSDAAVQSPAVFSCHAIAAGDGLPVPAIICRAPADQHRVQQLAMVLEDHPRSGPWIIREDPTGRQARAFGEDVQPWLLLGSPGLLVRAQDFREREPIEVTLVEDDVQTPQGALEQR